MKIEKIILRNFSAIKNAMNATEFSIDFTQAKNNVCLIIGPNGSGKTTLLSLLTPFAGLGNLDIRDGNDLILPKKEGYKEIHIKDGGDLYIIKHFYTPHEGKSHSVKSYIEKNGTELNVNGNVRSFKEYVKEELSIEEDYLKLIRLGSNVTSMINLSETERKNFMSKLLDEIGVSLAYYKKVNTDIRQLKQMIAVNVNKLDRLNIKDLSVAKKDLERYKIELVTYQEEYDGLTSVISVLEHEISLIEDPELLREKISNTTKKLKRMDSILEKKDELESTDVLYYTEKISALEKEKIRLENTIQSTNDAIESLLGNIDQYEEQQRLLMTQWEKEEQSDKELDKMREELQIIEKRLAERNVIFDVYQPKYTLNELSDFIVFLKNQQNIMDKTYEFGRKTMETIVGLLRKKQSVLGYTTSQIMSLDDQSEQENHSLLTQLSRRYDFNKQIDCCDTSCQPLMLWNHIKILLEDRIGPKEHESYEFYKGIELAYSNISEVFARFATYDSIIKSLPKDVREDFHTESMYKKIENLEHIFNERRMNDLLAESTEYENIMKLKSQRDELSESIERFFALSNFEYLSKQKEFYEKTLAGYYDDLKEKRMDLSDLIEKSQDVERSLERYDILKETFEKHDALSELLESLQKDFTSYRENLRKASEARNSLAISQMNINQTNEKIRKLSSDIDQYNMIKKELNHYEKIFDEMTLVKEALSSKKGMPLYHIKHYLGNTEEITNELLSIAYDGDIYIDPFHISPTEFRIPFHIRGKQMKDVKYASQGELSFLSIALSFGLSSQSLRRYNIMLLDEIDGPLDAKNRAKFIQILENQIDRIGSEQNFLITHNNMFSSYPVDIIDLSFSKETNEYRLANYIPVNVKP